MPPGRLRWTLRTLILALALLTALVTLLNALQAGYRVQRQMLIDETLGSHHAYATKLAASTEIYLEAALQLLAYGASTLPEHIDDAAFLQSEANRLRLQVASFNSVVITAADGTVLATSPEALALRGKHLQSAGAQQALSERRALISAPYLSAANNLVVFISQPIFAADGRYLGYVGGTIYLLKRNILYTLLGEHFYEDGSYLYVVDANRRLLYHPDASRIGEIVNGNTLLDHLPAAQHGRQQLTNSRGVEMLAGYARIPAANWLVVSARPLDLAMQHLQGLMLNMILKSLPVALLCLLGIWWCSRIIAQPLRRLAEQADRMDDPHSEQRIRPIRAWYLETKALKRALLQGIGLLHERIGQLTQDVQTDPLTGLFNRRALQRVELWQAQRRAFSVVTLDIDHFKRVNDTYGHAAGDQVLATLAELMRGCSRQGDLLCRVGGEEFAMLLPDTDSRAAHQVAERLRKRVEQHPMPGVGQITISLGVAHWAGEGDSSEETFKQADKALYEAKSAGRNQVRVASGQAMHG